MFDAKKIKEDFPIFENYAKKNGRELTYLDSAASSQTPKQVVEAMDEYYFGYRSNVHRSPYDLGEEATMAYEKARERAGRFIGADTGEIIFTSGATAGVNMLAYMLEQHITFKEGGEIVATISEHHSNLVPFQELAVRTGALLRTIALDGADLDYEGAENIISRKTKIFTMSLAGNVLGTIYDAKRMMRLAKKAGAITIIDASKAAGHMPIDVKALGCDFLFFSGHKMLGPTGIGVLYGRSEILEKLNPSFYGGGMVEKVSQTEAVYGSVPARFEPGTPNVAGAIGLSAAINYIENIGVREIESHGKKLVAYTIEKLGAIPGVRIFSEKDPKRNIGIVSFIVDGIHPHDVAEILGKDGVAIRGGHHCAMPLMKRLGVSGLCRASFYIYNDKEDVDRLAEGIERAKSVFSL